MVLYCCNNYLFIISRVLCTRVARRLTVKNKYSSFYVINIVFQSIFTLLWHIGLGLLVGWIFIRFFSAETWVYVPLIIAGVFTGLFSMVRFILAAMKALERIEEDKRKKKKLEEKKNGK